MPITATVMAVKAARGLMVCSAEEVVRKAIKVMKETKITAVPMAKFLWLNFSLTTSDPLVQLGLF